MQWIFYAVFAALSFGFYNFFVKLTSDKFSPTVGLLILTATSFLVALGATLFLKVSGRPIVFTRDAVMLPIFAGLATGLAEIFYLLAFSKGAPLGIGTTLVIGGTMIVATILGFVILKEPLSAEKIVGFLLVVGGLLLLTK